LFFSSVIIVIELESLLVVKLDSYWIINFFFPHGLTVALDHWTKASSLSRLHDHAHSDTPHSVGLLWTSDQPDAETSTRQHTTLTTDRHPLPQWDSIPQPQQASVRRPTPYTARPLNYLFSSIFS